jgi:hypothetical protein
MVANAMPIGFVALWKNKRSEYHAGPEEEGFTSRAITQAFERGRARGIQMFDRYGCRWSSAYQYFTFWRCPDLPVLEATMHDLERAGDFKFADSNHFIGTLSDGSYTAIRAVAEEGHSPARYAAVVLWRYTCASHSARSGDRARMDEAVTDISTESRLQSLGTYDCRWSTGWNGWTIWLSPSFEAMECTVARLEEKGTFGAIDCRFFIGNLEPAFRFGTHLQVETAAEEAV